MKVTTFGIDLAKNMFQLRGVNEFGKFVINNGPRPTGRGIGRFKLTQGTPQAARNLPAMTERYPC